MAASAQQGAAPSALSSIRSSQRESSKQQLQLHQHKQHISLPFSSFHGRALSVKPLVSQVAVDGSAHAVAAAAASNLDVTPEEDVPKDPPVMADVANLINDGKIIEGGPFNCSDRGGHSRLVCFLSKPSARALTTRPWTTSFSTHSLGLAAKKQRLLCALRKEQIHLDQDTFSGNLFVEIMKSIFRDIQNAVLFIMKQPKELRHVEFPSLQSAGRMAIFTIAVVMVLIVFLATVDSGLSFIVASVFRRIR